MAPPTQDESAELVLAKLGQTHADLYTVLKNAEQVLKENRGKGVLTGDALVMVHQSVEILWYNVQYVGIMKSIQAREISEERRGGGIHSSDDVDVGLTTVDADSSSSSPKPGFGFVGFLRNKLVSSRNRHRTERETKMHLKNIETFMNDHIRPRVLSIMRELIGQFIPVAETLRVAAEQEQTCDEKSEA